VPEIEGGLKESLESRRHQKSQFPPLFQLRDNLYPKRSIPVFTAYVVVAVLTAAASTSIATLDFIHSEWSSPT